MFDSLRKLTDYEIQIFFEDNVRSVWYIGGITPRNKRKTITL